MATEPNWLIEARKYIGLAEIPGPKHNPTIIKWLEHLKAWWRDDETPWCGVFVATCIDAAGIALPANWMRAKAWADWGGRLSAPVPGCVVVFERLGGGHVGFVVGRTANGCLMVLGGNQGNKVSIAPFCRDRVQAYVWPPGVPLPDHSALAVIDATGLQLSTNEA